MLALACMHSLLVQTSARINVIRKKLKAIIEKTLRSMAVYGRKTFQSDLIKNKLFKRNSEAKLTRRVNWSKNIRRSLNKTRISGQIRCCFRWWLWFVRQWLPTSSSALFLNNITFNGVKKAFNFLGNFQLKSVELTQLGNWVVSFLPRSHQITNKLSLSTSATTKKVIIYKQKTAKNDERKKPKNNFS